MAAGTMEGISSHQLAAVTVVLTRLQDEILSLRKEAQQLKDTNTALTKKLEQANALGWHEHGARMEKMDTLNRVNWEREQALKKASQEQLEASHQENSRLREMLEVFKQAIRAISKLEENATPSWPWLNEVHAAEQQSPEQHAAVARRRDTLSVP